jgi:hypothetical protein
MENRPASIVDTAALKLLVESLIEIVADLAPDAVEQLLLDTRGLYLSSRDGGMPPVTADAVTEALRILESAIGDPDENLLDD